jgi:hypothetical protein
MDTRYAQQWPVKLKIMVPGDPYPVEKIYPISTKSFDPAVEENDVSNQLTGQFYAADPGQIRQNVRFTMFIDPEDLPALLIGSKYEITVDSDDFDDPLTAGTLLIITMSYEAGPRGTLEVNGSGPMDGPFEGLFVPVIPEPE